MRKLVGVDNDDTKTYEYDSAEDRNQHVSWMGKEEGYIITCIAGGGPDGTPMIAKFKKA